MTEQALAFVVFGFVPLFFWFKFKKNSNPQRNFDTAHMWFMEMDAESGGQRYQGNRVTIHSHHGSGYRDGMYVYCAYCSTPSGREFLIEVFSKQCLVSNWEITALQPGTVQKVPTQ